MNALRAPIGQGYGLTETCAGATFTEPDDPNVGHVGPPLPCAYIKVCHGANYDEKDDCVSLSDNCKFLKEDYDCLLVPLNEWTWIAYYFLCKWFRFDENLIISRKSTAFSNFTEQKLYVM